MEFSVKIEGLDRATPERKQPKPTVHNGQRIASLLEVALNEMKRKGLVREHGE